MLWFAASSTLLLSETGVKKNKNKIKQQKLEVLRDDREIVVKNLETPVFWTPSPSIFSVPVLTH